MFDDAKPDDKINMTVGEFTAAIASTRRKAIEETAKFVEGLADVAVTETLRDARMDIAGRIRAKL